MLYELTDEQIETIKMWLPRSDSIEPIIESLSNPVDSYEYGIAYHKSDPIDVHRSGMKEDEAWHWIDEWVEDGGKEDAFYIIRRSIGKWEFYY